MKKTFMILILGFVVAVATPPAHAKKMDLSTHDALIRKLESVIEISDGDSMLSQGTLLHRLADLYSERARLLSIENEGQGEQANHAQITSDRTKALGIYKKIVGHLAVPEQGPVMLQMAHLHVLLGSEDAAVQIYQDMDKKAAHYDQASVALARVQLGDYAFLHGEYVKAQSFFEKSIKCQENPRLVYAQFRLAWVHFNLGQSQLAEKELTTLLQNKKENSMETSMQEEISHDLATFMAKNDINEGKISLLSRLSPENSRKKNLIYLASELDRTAKKKSALLVWQTVGTNEISADDQLERQIQITRIEYDLGHKTQLLQEIDKSIALLKACKQTPECLVARQNLRKIITDWGQAEERLTSRELVIAYQKFTGQFDDYEMSYWAAQAAYKLKMYSESYQFYKSAALLIGKMSAQEKAQPVRKHMLEGSVVGVVDVAELSQNAELRAQAYEFYLQQNPDGAKAADVRYQIAHLSYELNNYPKARDQFKVLILDHKMPLDLREKSADLCMDTDVLLKNELQIQSDAGQFAATFAPLSKTKSAEFATMYRKSLLNELAQVINAKPGIASEQEAELKKISAVDVHAWPTAERVLVLKNETLLSFKLKNLDALVLASQHLLKEKSLNLQERNAALQQLAWAYEMRLNFGEALAWTKKIQVAPAQQAEHLYKLAMLKELLHQNPSPEYTKFVVIAKSPAQKSYAAHQLVLFAKSPKTTFNRYSSYLKAQPELYRSAAMFVYQQQPDAGLARKLLSDKLMRHSDEAFLLQHIFAFKDFDAASGSLAHLKLDAKTDARLKRSLQARTKAMALLQKQANQAISAKDTTLQLMYLSRLANENNRLASEILALPAPRGISAAEKTQYQQQLQSFAQPYTEQATAIQRRSLELWQQSMSGNSFKALYEWSEQRDHPGHKLASAELSRLRGSARRLGLKQDPFANFSDERRKAAAEVPALEKSIQENPFDFGTLGKLKSVQSDLGSGPMIAYLDGRLSELRAQGGRN